MAGPTREEGPGRAVREAVRQLRDLTSADSQVSATERREGVLEIASLLRSAAGEAGDVELVIGTNRITYGDDTAYKSDARENNLAFELFRQGLRRVTFKAGVSDEEVATFVHHFGECREIEKVDEDFVSTLWRENLPGIQYVAIDGFTEKIFMADGAFTSTFAAVVTDVCPGLLDMAEDDEPDRQPRPRRTLDEQGPATTAFEQVRVALKAIGGPAATLRSNLRATWEGKGPLEHLLQLLAGFVVKHPCALSVNEIGDAILVVFEGLYRDFGPEEFADAGRTFLALTDESPAYSREQNERVRAVRGVIAGRAGLAMAVRHYRGDRPEVTAWLRWYFVAPGVIAAPDLLGLINSTPHGAGHDFLKDLLRRQGTSSLEPWAERLRDDNPGVVLEVLDVILGSELGDQAQPLLIDLLRHKVPEVRARAIDGLRGAYSQPLRQALLPLLRDPSPDVRRAVLGRFTNAGDTSVATYVATTVKSPMFLEFDDDEQRQFFESLSLLGGERFIDVYRERLNLDEAKVGALGKLFKRGVETLHDSTVRRAALSGLGLLGTPQAIALIRECHAKAELELAASCEVALRVAARGGGDRPEPVPIAHSVSSGADSQAIVAAGAERLGSRLLFEAAPFRVEPPQRPRHVPIVTARPVVDLFAAPPPPILAEAPSARETMAIGDLPLLAPGEVFLREDERRLRAEPGRSEDGRFAMTSPRVALIGIEAARPGGMSPVLTPLATPRASRVVEKSARAVTHADWTHQPDATLVDILSSYLDDEEAAGSGSGQVARAPAPARNEIPTLAARPVSTPQRTPNPVTRPASAEQATPAPVARPVVPPPVPTPAPRPVAKPVETPQPSGSAKPAAIDDVLKEFLDLDLGD